MVKVIVLALLLASCAVPQKPGIKPDNAPVKASSWMFACDAVCERKA